MAAGRDLRMPSTPILLEAGTTTISNNYNFITGTPNFLEAARKINSDTKCYIRRSNFTSALTKRFYKNNSLLAHGKALAKERNLHEKRRVLLEGIEAENGVLKLLEVKLLEEITRLREELDRHQKQVLRCIETCQGHVRRRRACQILQERRVEYNAKCRVALFVQKRMRGWQSRRFVCDYRQKVEVERTERIHAATRIQTKQRQRVSMHTLSQLKDLRLRLRIHASVTIQSFARTARCQRVKRDKLFLIRQEQHRTRSAVNIQCFIRNHLSKIIMRRMIDERRMREDKARNELLSRHQIVPPVVLVSPPRRPFVVGKPQPESIARMMRDIRDQTNLIEEVGIPSTDLNDGVHGYGTPAKSTIGQSLVASPQLSSFGGVTRGSDSFVAATNQIRTDACLIISDADIIESARRKASVRAARVAKQRRERKESEQATAKEAAKRAINLELKRKQQLLRTKATRRNYISPSKSVIIDGSTIHSEPSISTISVRGSPNKALIKGTTLNQQIHSSSIRPRELETNVLEVSNDTSTNCILQQNWQSITLPPEDPLFPPLLDVSFEDLLEETENDLESYSES
jgi:hypothetical protein